MNGDSYRLERWRWTVNSNTYDIDPFHALKISRKRNEISTALYNIANVLSAAEIDTAPFRELIERTLVERWLGETLVTDDELLLALAAIDDPRSIPAIKAWLALPAYSAKPIEYGEAVLKQLQETEALSREVGDDTR